MAGTGVIQPSFTSGELAPALYGRIDLARYQTGLKTCKNFIVRQYGGVSNRPGTTLVREVKTSSKAVRLIDFQFSVVQSYVLEFGDKYMRIHKDGATVVDGSNNPIEITTPWEEADLPRLSYTQSADVLTVCHPDFAPRQISRTSHTAWNIGLFDPQKGPFLEINVDDGKTISCSASTGTVTLEATGFTPFSSANIGDLVYLEQLPESSTVVWETSLLVTNGQVIRAGGNYYKATSSDPSEGRITGSYRPDHTEGKAWDGGGRLEGAVYRAPGATENSDAYVGVEWEYLHSGFGIVEITAVTDNNTATGTVVSYVPSSISTGTYKWAFSAWSEAEGYPSATGYHSQRQVFGGTLGQPQTVWFSSVGGYNDFSTSIPVLDDEAITFTLASREVNEIRHFLPLSELILLTSGGEWLVKGDQSGALLPSTINVKAQGFGGSSYLPPIVVGSTALYVQDKGTQVRALGYSFEQDAFIGNDLTVLSSHLFQGRQLVSWAFQKIPFSVAWCVRDDGKLLGLTYLREQEVVGWHQHETDGFFESVCTVSEGNEDAVYFVVRRTINGTTKRYIERLDTRFFDDVRDCKFLDCSLSYDGRNTAATTMTLTGGTNYDQTESLTLTSSVAFFDSGLIGDEIFLYGADNIVYRLRITAYTSNTVVTVQSNRTVPSAYRTAVTDWALARDAFSGLSHLEGKTVSILADGNVHPQVTVSSGAVALQYRAAVVHIGLPYDADFETLPLSVQGQNIRDKQKLIPKVSLLCEESRGIFAGPDATNLTECKQRSTESYDQAIVPANGMFEVLTQTKWDKNGIVFVRQSDPLPLSILAVIPEVSVGGS